MKLSLEKPAPVELDRKLVPPNVDPKAIERLLRNHERMRKTQSKAELEAAQREVDLLEQFREPGLTAVDEKKAAVLAKTTRDETRKIAAEAASAAETVTGHNPNFFPPFFGAGSSGVVGGVVDTPRFRQQPASGLISISVAAYMPGGHISRAASMGAFTVAPSTEMATLTASAFVGATIASITALGYARASANLLVDILADGPAGFRSSSGSRLIGDLVFGVNRIPLTNMSATARLMVSAGDVLLVSCGLRVTAGCGGLVCAATSNVAISGAVLCLT
jgi:hypothetical protein